MARVAVASRSRTALGEGAFLAMQTGLTPLPPNATVEFATSLPACQLHYALNEDCFELRVPHTLDGTEDVRCRLPRPIPMRPWCVGEEGSHPPYQYYDPRLGWRLGQLHQEDFQQSERRVLEEGYKKKGYEVSRYPLKREGAADVYRFGKQSALQLKPKMPESEVRPSAKTPRKITVDSAAQLPVCKARYVVNDDCFELEPPFSFQHSLNYRCRLPKPMPNRPLCIGAEGSDPPYWRFHPQHAAPAGKQPEIPPLAVISLPSMPVCDYHYALNGDCWEIRKLYTEDSIPEHRCKLPKPLPTGNWCVGDEGRNGPYAYHDPAGVFGPNSIKETMERVKPDTQDQLRQCLVTKAKLSNSFTVKRKPTPKLAPKGVYNFGAKGELLILDASGESAPDWMHHLTPQEMYPLLPPEVRDPKTKPESTWSCPAN